MKLSRESDVEYSSRHRPCHPRDKGLDEEGAFGLFEARPGRLIREFRWSDRRWIESEGKGNGLVGNETMRARRIRACGRKRAREEEKRRKRLEMLPEYILIRVANGYPQTIPSFRLRFSPRLGRMMTMVPTVIMRR